MNGTAISIGNAICDNGQLQCIILYVSSCDDKIEIENEIFILSCNLVRFDLSQVRTCSMGRGKGDPNAVVDSNLRFHKYN
jgi:hypothetical protein